MFEVYTITIAAIVIGGMLWGVYRRNDTFHPLVYLLPMVGYLYVFLPLTQRQVGVLDTHFTGTELNLLQGLNLACVVALALGVVAGDRGLRRNPEQESMFSTIMTPAVQARLRRMAVIFGSIGVLLFIYGIYNVGGFVEAFDTPKGGGTATTGWLRDVKMFVIPSILLLYMSQRGRSWTPAFWGWLILFASPLVIRSLLRASRGWTFMAASALVVGWYFVQNRRPRFVTVLAGGTALGVLMLVLVSIRGQIYIGSDFFEGDRPAVTTILDRAIERPTRGGYGNEFIFGGYAILLSKRQNDHYWGQRYFAYTFVRPIPSLFWPTKYRDVGAGGVRRNAGTLGNDHPSTLEQEVLPPGVYPGFVGDLFVEFSWGAIPAAFLFGWIYGGVWRRYLIYGGYWTIVYHALFAFSVFAMMQTIAAAYIARVLLVAVPPVLLWWYWIPDARRVVMMRRRSHVTAP